LVHIERILQQVYLDSAMLISEIELLTEQEQHV
jgi:hypothetical protein